MCQVHCDIMKQWCYIKDEGRPLGIDWQKLISNRCMLHQLRVGVVSDTLKVCFNRPVSVQEAIENEPLMRCRNRKDDVRARFQALTWDKSGRCSAYCLGGIRHRGGVTRTEAFMWNLGTCRPNAKGKLKQRSCKGERTDVGHRGGPVGSSEETTVMAVERSNWLIEQTSIKQLKKRRI